MRPSRLFMKEVPEINPSQKLETEDIMFSWSKLHIQEAREVRCGKLRVSRPQTKNQGQSLDLQEVIADRRLRGEQ